jgi:hypothetical protein
VVNFDLTLRLFRRNYRKSLAQRAFPDVSSRSLPILFANSFPKSGTHLLTQILSGFATLGPFVESGLPAVVTFEGDTGAQRPLPVILEDLRRYIPGDIGYGHLHAIPEIVSQLTADPFASIFIYRDPRDAAVSHAFYVADINPKHAHHELYSGLTGFDERLKTSIMGRTGARVSFPDIGSRFRPYLGWLQQDVVLSLRYEDLVSSPEEWIGAIYDHIAARGFGYPGRKAQAIRVLKGAINPEKSPTYRKGMIGGWKEHFKEEHKTLFKQCCGELLIDLGYEKDPIW